ncbi:helix-turn-helix domain-containing protein [uncultured Draconibacterium sp.]|uniref:helix-turn-helix domain-containing protein n=1 Tax=uncultured Draconibacterium sp. TaxID=1573823 RepID=UPI0025F06ECB|nr:helix-turn-helix domain-containing protein [uncultured Draconibacterium sp.]
MPDKTNSAEFRGIWISKEIMEMPDLNLIEKCMLAVIVSLSSNGQKCTASNAYFAKLFGLTKKRISAILNDLRRKKRIGILVKRDRVSSEVEMRVCTPIGIGIPKKAEEIEKPIKKDYKKGNNTPQFNFKKSLIDLGVEERVAIDWLKVRSEKKASNTETAFTAIKNQIEISGLSANDCIKKAAEESWKGFKASWLDEEYRTNNKRGEKGAETARTVENIIAEIEQTQR